MTHSHTAVGPNDPPPGQPIHGGEDVSDGPGCSREARFFGYLSVGRNLAGQQTSYGRCHATVELGGHGSILEVDAMCVVMVFAMAWREDEPVRGGYPDPSLLSLSGLDRMKATFRRQMPVPRSGISWASNR